MYFGAAQRTNREFGGCLVLLRYLNIVEQCKYPLQALAT